MAVTRALIFVVLTVTPPGTPSLKEVSVVDSAGGGGLGVDEQEVSARKAAGIKASKVWFNVFVFMVLLVISCLGFLWRTIVAVRNRKITLGDTQ
jgi:hypothetical protein